MEINKTTIIKLDLTVEKLKNDKFVVGNIKKDVFLEVPTEFLYILEFSDGKKSIEQIEQEIFQNYSIHLDVIEIMNTLHEVGLIFSIDGKIIGEDNNVLYSPILKKIAYLFFLHLSIYFYIRNIYF